MTKQTEHDAHTAHPADRPNVIPWPPIILVCAIAAGYLLNRLVPLPWVPSPLSDILFAAGLLAIVSALAIDVSAMRTMHRARTTILPHRASSAFVAEGPFKVSRNPIYVANVMIVTGLGLVFANAWYLPLAVAVGLLINALAIPGEERHLEHKFGKHYRDYKKKVRRWI